MKSDPWLSNSWRVLHSNFLLNPFDSFWPFPHPRIIWLPILALLLVDIVLVISCVALAGGVVEAAASQLKAMDSPYIDSDGQLTLAGLSTNLCMQQNSAPGTWTSLAWQWHSDAWQCTHTHKLLLHWRSLNYEWYMHCSQCSSFCSRLFREGLVRVIELSGHPTGSLWARIMWHDQTNEGLLDRYISPYHYGDPWWERGLLANAQDLKSKV